jgi:PAS domain S-box-containing protein
MTAPTATAHAGDVLHLARASAFDAMSDAVLVADDERRYVDANHAATRLFGLARADLLGSRIDDFAPAPSGFDVEAAWREFLSTGEQRGEFPLMRADGTSRIVEYRAKANIIPGRHLSVLRDVTERVEARARLEETVHMRDELMAIVSHDLRNPLNAIRSAAALLLKRSAGTDEDPVARYARLIERNSARMDALIADLLDFTSMREGLFAIERVEADLFSLVDEAAHMIEPRAQESGIELVVLVPNTITLQCDPRRMLQALANLLSNAVKFTPRGGRVELSGRADGDDVLLSVKDSGAGIAAEHLALVFDRFWQARNDRRGNGLGLAIVKGIVDAHRGSITVTSVVDAGSTFTIRVPARFVPSRE